ncbi:hypothetical protein N0V88_000794 [Collariella sp. IMI 366227]|nr:hypothetical protein N0V88_000794 [Collariella sp. IMI 366227]
MPRTPTHLRSSTAPSSASSLPARTSPPRARPAPAPARRLQSASSSTTTTAAAQQPSIPIQTAAQAEQYLAYLRAQRTYVTLIERYNPGMGMDEEERVRLSARRVGMDLPKEYENGEGEKN